MTPQTESAARPRLTDADRPQPRVGRRGHVARRRRRPALHVPGRPGELGAQRRRWRVHQPQARQASAVVLRPARPTGPVAHRPGTRRPAAPPATTSASRPFRRPSSTTSTWKSGCYTSRNRSRRAARTDSARSASASTASRWCAAPPRGFSCPASPSTTAGTPRSFLDRVCAKAELPPTAWKEDDTALFTFEGEALSGKLADQRMARADPSRNGFLRPEDLAVYTDFCRRELIAVLSGGTPSYYLWGAADGNVNGVVLSLHSRGRPGCSTSATSRSAPACRCRRRSPRSFRRRRVSWGHRR